MHSFRHLRVWQEAIVLAGETYRAARSLPRDFAPVRRQMHGAARLVHANIAEGSGSTSSKDFMRFLEYSQKSLRELESDVIALRHAKLLPPSVGVALSKRIGQVETLLVAFMRRISRGE